MTLTTKWGKTFPEIKPLLRGEDGLCHYHHQLTNALQQPPYMRAGSPAAAGDIDLADRD